LITGFPIVGQSCFAGMVKHWRAGYGTRGLALLAACVAWTNAAVAKDPASLEVKLVYVSNSGCPTEATFSAGLRRLMPHLELSAVAGRTPQVQVTFERRDREFVGRLVYGETTREVTASACADAAYALAVVTAITLEPDAEFDRTTVDADDFTEGHSVTFVEQKPPGTDGTTGNPVQGPRPQTTHRKSKSGSSAASVAPSSIPGVQRWTLLLGPLSTYGELGAPAWGGDFGALSAGKSGFSAYRVSLRAVYGIRDLTVTALSYTRAGAALAWCPRFAGTHGWQARACVGGEIGFANVSTSETPNVQQPASRSGLSAAASLDVVLSFALGSRWRLVLVPGLVAPLVRHQYVLESSAGLTTRSVQHPPVVGAAGVQVGYAFE
jgi:hypothetical protein